jgi:SAM-dependent methyltransferase
VDLPSTVFHLGITDEYEADIDRHSLRRGGSVKRFYFRMPGQGNARKTRFRRLKGGILGLYYWGAAHAHDTPGLSFHRKIAGLGIRLFCSSGIRFREAYDLVFRPMDSFRYFEFGTLWGYLPLFGRGAVRYLDVSSPRLFPLVLLNAFPNVRAEILNPDGKDLDNTIRLMDAAGLSGRCRFHRQVVDDLDFPQETFDLVTSISAIEHIPGGGDRRAFEKLWLLLKPGGRFLLTVPCAREPFEEYMDFNEYGLLPPDGEGFVFGWTCYDAEMIRGKFFGEAGEPERIAVYGERTAGSFFRNRIEKIANPDYPFWKEPYMMGRDYRWFGSVGELPGVGVAAMEFVKK